MSNYITLAALVIAKTNFLKVCPTVGSIIKTMVGRRPIVESLTFHFHHSHPTLILPHCSKYKRTRLFSAYITSFAVSVF